MAKKHEATPTTEPTAPATEAPAKVEPVHYYTVGKPYNVKADHNTRTWDRILDALASGPKTMAELQKVCVYEHNGEVVDHKRFARYMVRTKHLVVHDEKAK